MWLKATKGTVSHGNSPLWNIRMSMFVIYSFLHNSKIRSFASSADSPWL